MIQTEFFKAIKAGKIQRVYFFSGSEDLIRKSAEETLKEKLLQPGLEMLNLTVLGDPSVQEIIESCETLPMMSDRRIVLVERSRYLPLKKKDSKKSDKNNEESKDKAVSEEEKRETERLCAYLDKVPDFCCLVFSVSGSADARGKLAAALLKLPGAVSFDPLGDHELYQWIGQKARKAGKNMDENAREQLAFVSGRKLDSLRNEIEKLAAYVGERTDITAEDVERAATHTSECTVFQMVDRIADGRIADAFGQLSTLLEAGEKRIGILALITRHYRQLLYLRIMKDGGMRQQEMIRQLGVPAFSFSRMERQLGARSADELGKKLELCVDTDYAIKSGRMEEGAALERLMFSLVS